MNADRCIKTIIDETQTRLTKQEVGAIVEMLIAYDVHPRNQQVFGPFSSEQGRIQAALENPQTATLQNARDTLIARARLIAAQQRANVVMDAAKRGQRFITYGNAGDESLGVQAKLIGTNTPFLGNRDSAAAAIEGNTYKLLGTFDEELKQAGLDRIFASGAMERDWTRELFELNRVAPGPRRPVTRNPQALQIARIVQNLQRRAVEMLNNEGAFIGSYDGYITRTTHDKDLIRRMGEDRWIGYAQQWFDIPTIYPNRDQAHIETQLRAQYKRIVSGLHDSYDPDELDLVPEQASGQNLAKKVSESRVIHFKDADSWLAYMSVASQMTPSQIIMRSAMSAARDAGLMRVWGTNPKRAMQTDIQMLQQEARGRSDFDMIERLQTQNRSYELWMDYMTGEANRPHNETAARITSNLLSAQRMAKLGFLPFAQLVDLASVSGELRYQGVGFLNRMTSGVMAYFRGGMNSEKRQVADLLGAYLEGELAEYNAHLEINDPRHLGGFTGRLNRLQDIFFRYSGAQALTNRARGGLLHMMSRHMGSYHGQFWGALGESEQRIMSAFNIGENEWNALMRAPWTVGREGNTYLTPRDALNIPDAAISVYNQATGVVWEYQAFREAMADRLYSYYADRMDYGVLNPGVAEKAILYQGARPGSPLGITLRLVMQFKSFMAANFRRTWGREIYGGQGALGAVAGIAEYAVTGAVLGVLANGLNQLFKGQDPFSQWDNDPGRAILAGLTRAGTSSMIGDFLFGELGRHGQSVAAYLLGPNVGTVEQFMRAYQTMREGENPAGELLSFVRGMTPFANMFYTKMALDFLVWNGLTEMASPGYLRRTERRLKQTQGIEFLKYPVDMSPNNLRAF